MEPNCVVFLHGHGQYDRYDLFSMDPYDYKIIFPTSLNGIITDTHHNYLTAHFALNVSQANTVLSSLPTTYTASKAKSNALNRVNLTAKDGNWIHEHYLSAGSDVKEAFSFNQLAPDKYAVFGLKTSGRLSNLSDFVEFFLSSEEIHKNVEKALEDPTNSYHPAKLNKVLLSNTCIGIEIKEKILDRVCLSLSQFLNDILPNVRIPAVFHGDTRQMEIIEYIYLYDEYAVGFRAKDIREKFTHLFKKPTDLYFEALVPNNAHIVWDACRERCFQ